jgi:hypothetical protein
LQIDQLFHRELRFQFKSGPDSILRLMQSATAFATRSTIDRTSIDAGLAKPRGLKKAIGDCGGEYR